MVKEVGTQFNRVRNTINENFNNLQGQINQLGELDVNPGNSAEIALARVGIDGKQYNSVKERIDGDINDRKTAEQNLLNKELGGDVNGDVIFKGKTTFVGSQEQFNPVVSTIDSQFFKSNNNQTGTPVLNGGLEVERGDLANVKVEWDEGQKVWLASDEVGNKVGLYTQYNQFNMFSDSELRQPLDGGAATNIVNAKDFGFPFDVNAISNIAQGSKSFNIDISNWNLQTGEKITVFAYIKTNVAGQAGVITRFVDANNQYLGAGAIYSRRVAKIDEWCIVSAVIDVPDGAVKLYFGLSNNQLSTSYLAYPHFIKGYTPTIPNVDIVFEDQLSKSLTDRLNRFDSYLPDYFSTIIADLKDPFKKTQVKLIGDSITAGVGGTGYSLTGPLMFTDHWSTARYENVRTATCWANMLGDRIERFYKIDHYISVINPNVTVYPDAIPQKEEATLLDWRLLINNINQNDLVKFNFYGDHFSIIHSVISGGGILDIYVDGVLHSSLDTYGTTAYSVEFPITGLTLGEHEVLIKATNTKNASSIGTGVYLEGFKIPKTLIFKNWGISGIDSKYFYNNKDNYFESTDDIYIIQIGTNDRSAQVSPEATKTYLRELMDEIVLDGKKVILMSANAVSISNETDTPRNFYMHDVDNLIEELAIEFQMPYISNYQSFFEYEDKTGNSMDLLLGDGLHPNDAGYNIMFENIIKLLKLPRIRPGL